jgi:hypothetical protein
MNSTNQIRSAILNGMSENSVSPPFITYSVPIPSKEPNIVAEGIKSGIRVAMILGILYALCIPIMLIIVDGDITTRYIPANLRDINEVMKGIGFAYLSYFALVSAAIVAGSLFASLGGVIGGAIIGMIFRHWIMERLSLRLVIWYGVGISLSLVGVSLLIGAMFSNGYTINQFKETFVWLAWFVPNIIAFFGCSWTVYQVNTKMPTS